MFRRSILGMPAVLAAAAVPGGSVWSQAWPSRQPLKLVAVFPPGGSVDQVARILAPQLQQQLGQSVVVDNKGGASGSIGTASVAAAAPDGYSFAVVFDTHAVNPSLMPGLPFDTRKDLVPLALIGTSAMVLVTHPDSPYRTMADVVAAARKGPAPSYGSIGNGSLGHLAMALLAREGRMQFVHVPYRGGGPLMTDALAGHLPLAVGSVFLAKPHLDARKLRPLAVTSRARSAALPEVPTLAEAGFAGFEAPAWWAVLAPARTPPEIVERMNREINAALRVPEVAARLAAQGIELHLGSAQAAQAFIERQIDTWAAVVRDNGIKAE